MALWSHCVASLGPPAGDVPATEQYLPTRLRHSVERRARGRGRPYKPGPFGTTRP
jgi:hypothetical protein